MNKIRIRIRKISGLRIRFEIRIRSKKRFVSTLIFCEAEVQRHGPNELTLDKSWSLSGVVAAFML